MKARLLAQAFGALFAMLDSARMKEVADIMLDFLEDKIESSDAKWDDRFLPWISMVRTTFNIPDNDDPAL